MPQASHSKSLSRERFSRLAADYVNSQTHASGSDLERLVAIANHQPTWNVLDVATGGGHTALAFSPHVASVVASDLSSDMLRAARDHLAAKGSPNVIFLAAEAEGLPLASGAFDLVTCRIAAHHFPDLDRFVRECSRVLKPGGALLVQDQLLPEEDTTARYIDAYERRRDPSHHRAYSASEWRKFYIQSGLRVEHTEELTKPLEFHAWAQRQSCTPEIIAELELMVLHAPDEVLEWMQPQAFGSSQASFLIHYLIILGRKP
jgi:ubiquinone/menaquinone biosynthesis C-methylase UbiE